MNEFFKIGVPAFIGLVGVLLTALFAYLQWRRQSHHQHIDQLAIDTKAAYKELWDKLETIHVALRVEDLDDSQVSSSVRDLNAFILRSSLYLDDSDRSLANRYITEVRSLCDCVRALGSEEDKEDMCDTRAFDMTPINEIRGQERKTMAVREQIRTKIRDVLKNGIA